MEPRVRLSPRFASVHRTAGRLVLTAEDEVRCIEDPTLADLIQSVALEGPASDLDRLDAGALDRLRQEGLLAVPSTLSSPAAAYWESANCPPPRFSVGLRALSPAAEDLIHHALRANHVTVADPPDLLVVTTDDYLRPQLEEIRMSGATWLLAKPVGHTIWLGPLFIPGRTACWCCLASWLKPHRWPQCSIYGWEAGKYAPQPSVAHLPTTIGFAAGMIATAATVWAARGEYPELENAVLAIDTRTMRIARSVLHSRPECPHCGHLPLRTERNLYSFVSPITGIVSAMEVTDEPVAGLYHAHAVFAPPLPVTRCRPLLRLQHGVGKALSPADAEAACIAECIERYSLIYQGNERLVRGRIDQVEGIHPESILLFSDAQYLHRDHWNANHSQLHWAPERFDASREIEWQPFRSLRDGRTAYAPAGVTYMYYPFPGCPKYAAGDTNGCAAGKTFTEAQLHATLELVERDAVAIWWYNRIPRPAIDLETFEDSRLLELRSAFDALGRDLYILDIANDTGIPAFVAVAPNRDGSEPVFGAAAAVSPLDAAWKAATEAAQICLWVYRQTEERELISWIRHANLDEFPYLRPEGVQAAPLPRPLAPDAGLRFCVERLALAGIEPFSVDLTRPETGLPVARVIAPGLRHFWARLGPGRLYAVPPRMGWLPAPRDESQMNPVPCMI